MDKKLLFTTFFLIFSAFTFAQNGKIQGVVSDGITGESLIGVNIMYAPGKGAITDVNGEFEFNLPYGNYELTFSYVGYNQTVKKVNLNKESIIVNVKLKNTTFFEETLALKLNAKYKIV